MKRFAKTLVMAGLFAGATAMPAQAAAAGYYFVYWQLINGVLTQTVSPVMTQDDCNKAFSQLSPMLDSLPNVIVYGCTQSQKG